MIETANPLLNAWSGPLCAPPFAEAQPAHFLPALHDAIALHDAELASIRENDSPPDFENTIAALERSGAALARIRRMFWTLSSAQATDAIRGIEADVSALLNDHGTAISHDSALFSRIAKVYASRQDSGLDGAQLRLVETSYAGFVRGGAALDGDAKARFAEIDARLAQLSIQFSQNIMAATSDWALVLTQDDLDGLSDAMRSGAAARAEAAGKPGEYHFSLGRGDYEAFLTFSSRRDLREKLWLAFTSRCDGGAHDNWPIIAEILGLRDERARLLGFANYADYVLDDSMARTPDAARDLLDQLWSPALRRATEEAAELQALIDADGDTFALAAWDWRFYAERVRRDRYAMDGGTIRAYLRLDEVRQAAFDTASRLYDLRFHRREDLVGYHPDVWAWEVTDGAGAAVGLLFTDYLARPEKHGGAWMGSLRVQEKLDGDIRPIVYLVANFPPAPPPDLGSTRLSVDEARTLFHEFGHALHGLLSDVVYPSQSGTSVARDFVEFPSKFMENWMVSREVLSGMGVPDPLIDALRKAEEYGQGFAAVELVSCALLDLAMHQSPDAAADPKAFMQAELARLGMPDTIGLRHQLPYFSHIFDGGYASGYYSYLWSEVLDADAFEAFTQAGDIFDPALAARFRREVLSQGDQRDPMVSYQQFRGHAPDTNALLRARYLI
ncbi:M3 family peptidase [Sphingobium sp. SCG-1]|uniref:M3 family metallopeptidase n=1 Tax=Sphingobium sp. SCG-1 TaxID=2072936 RepID=UPI000CD67F02|nr:M3 family metallopeptidase [Sphingobium sp. SCG-1]AUW57352.1 M3 family peptidase [Sphingobium sp. SCG-1]